MGRDEYKSAVNEAVASITGWSVKDAANVTGDTDEFLCEGLSPREAAAEIVLLAAEESV